MLRASFSDFLFFDKGWRVVVGWFVVWKTVDYYLLFFELGDGHLPAERLRFRACRLVRCVTLSWHLNSSSLTNPFSSFHKYTVPPRSISLDSTVRRSIYYFLPLSLENNRTPFLFFFLSFPTFQLGHPSHPRLVFRRLIKSSYPWPFNNNQYFAPFIASLPLSIT